MSVYTSPKRNAEDVTSQKRSDGKSNSLKCIKHRDEQMTSEKSQKILLVHVFPVWDKALWDPVKCICVPCTHTYTNTPYCFTLLIGALYYVGMAKSHYSLCVPQENSSARSVFFNKISCTCLLCRFMLTLLKLTESQTTTVQSFGIHALIWFACKAPLHFLYECLPLSRFPNLSIYKKNWNKCSQ